MFCAAYNQSLTDAAASGEALAPALQEHLASCESCRASFAEEQSLFAAIDSGLRMAANSEVPSTLIPRIHVALNNQPAPRSQRFSLPVWTFAGAVVTAATIFAMLYSPFRHSSNPVNSARVSPPTVIAPTNPVPSIVNATPSVGVSTLQHGKRNALPEFRAVDAKLPEVIVASEEGTALLRYEEFLRRKSAAQIQAAAVRSLDVPQGIQPLEIAALELGDLKIPPLSKSESDGGSK